MDVKQYVVVDGVVVSASEAAKSADPALAAVAKRIEFDMEQVRLRAEEQKRKAAERAAMAREA